MFHQPRLINVVVYLILGIVSTIAGGKLAMPEWLAAVVYVVQFVFYGAAVLSGFDWMMFENIAYVERLRRSTLATRTSITAESLAKLTPEQLELLRAELLGTQLPQRKESTYTTIDGTDIPDDWIKKYLLSAVGMQLIPVRRYADGTPERRYAVALIRHLESKGAITPAAGPNPARIRDWNQVYQALGWV